MCVSISTYKNLITCKLNWIIVLGCRIQSELQVVGNRVYCIVLLLLCCVVHFCVLLHFLRYCVYGCVVLPRALLAFVLLWCPGLCCVVLCSVVF